MCFAVRGVGLENREVVESYGFLGGLVFQTYFEIKCLETLLIRNLFEVHNCMLSSVKNCQPLLHNFKLLKINKKILRQ